MKSPQQRCEEYVRKELGLKRDSGKPVVSGYMEDLPIQLHDWLVILYATRAKGWMWHIDFNQGNLRLKGMKGNEREYTRLELVMSLDDGQPTPESYQPLADLLGLSE